MPKPCFNQRFDIRSIGIGIHSGVKIGHIGLIRKRQRLGEQLCTSDDPNLRTIQTVIRNRLLTSQIKRIIKAGDHGRPRRTIHRIMGNHNVVTVGQRTVLHTKRFPGLTAHNHRMRDGQLLEMLHVFSTMPRHTAVEPDGASATFLVAGLSPNKIHRESLWEIIAPVFFSGRQPGRSGLGFVIAATATVMLHFAVLLLDCGTGP